MKQVCVIGLGQFGSHLAQTLAKMNCEVLAIDLDERAVAAVRDKVQQTLILDVRDLEALRAVIPEDLDEAVVSLGQSLEASILATLHLSKLGVKRIRSKASSMEHATILRAIGATEMIFPEQDTAERMARQIVNPDLLDYLPLSPDYHVVEIGVPEHFVGQSLAELHIRKRYDVLVIAIKNLLDKSIVFLPPADRVLQKDNTLVLIGKEDDLAKLPRKEEGRK
jgi:trk system potassium uptake protein TrkA